MFGFQMKFEYLITTGEIAKRKAEIKPTDFETELRIYQLDDVNICFPEPDVIFGIMEKIVRFDQKIEHIKLGG